VTASFRILLVKVWDSPTFMTWGSFLSRSLSLVIVLPLLLTRLKTAEISLWYLFMTIIGLQMVVDAGFSPTFTRIIAYVMGGAGIHELKVPQRTDSGIFDPQALNRVYSTMQRVYIRLGAVWTLLLATIGTVALIKPISLVHDVLGAWISWLVIVAISCVSLLGNQYSSYLQGVNQIAILRRWETATALGGIATSFIVLILGGGLLGLVIANQVWQLIGIIRNRWLAGKVEGGILRSFVSKPFDREVFQAVWPSTWRSGVGILMSYGVIQVSGIIYAQVGKTAEVAAYLLGLRLIQTISQFSQAPFYSKIPVLSRLYIEGRQNDLVRLAQRGMHHSHWSYASGFAVLGLAGEPLLRYIGSHVSFPEPLLWSLLGIAIFFERFGAMHIQLYSTTNHIIWHIANGVSGAIYLLVSLVLLKHIGVYSFPVGIMAGYLGFFSWYTAKHSYSAFDINILRFESRCSFFPSVFMIVVTVLMILRHKVFGI
jgi:hypothetical protein